jgi:hypothetical protein
MLHPPQQTRGAVAGRFRQPRYLVDRIVFNLQNISSLNVYGFAKKMRLAVLVRLVAALLAALPLLFAAIVPAAGGEAAELVMFRKKACPYCAAWDRDVGGIYDATPEGRAAPLRMVDMDEDRADGLQDIEPIIYSPTFVLMEGGREVGRITGYPGAEFFWPMLQGLLSRIDI